MTARELARLARDELANGGFTLSIDGDTPASGFAVAVYPQAERVIVNPTAEDILHYIIDWTAVLYNDTRAHLGGWVSDGQVYLDISAVIDDRDEALSLARENNQKAVWDLANSEEIAVS